MIQTQVPAIDRTIHLTNEWLHEIALVLGRDEQHAWRALRATLHVLRDRLPITEAAHLAAQLPALVRGVFWEGWRPTGSDAVAMRDRESFLAAVQQGLEDPTIAAEQAARAVFDELSRRVTPGEIAQVRNALPQPIRELWDDPRASSARA